MVSKRKCKADIKQLATFCATFEKLPSDSLTNALLEVKHAELERRWIKMLESFENFSADEDEIKEEEDSLEEMTAKYEEACEKYQVVKADMVSRLKETAPKPEIKDAPRSTLKLPPVEITVFEGGFDKWPAFRDMFMAVVGNEPTVAPAHKLYYLLSKTRGEAYQLIKDYELVDLNFDLAWQTLIARYENKRILINNQIKRIYGIQGPQNETLKFLRLLQNTVNDGLSVIRAFEIEVADNDPFLMHICTSKLPEETSRAWEQSITDHKELPAWNQLNKFLSDRIETLETFNNLRKPSYRDNQNNKSQVFHSTIESENKKITCNKCQQSHPLRFCKYFKSLTVNDRIKYVYSSKLCSNCLSPHHFKTNCTSASSCLRCNKRHHTLLHLDNHQPKKNPVSQPSHQNNRRNDEKPSGSGTQRNTILSHNISVRGSPANGNGCEVNLTQLNGTTILPTALVQIVHLGETFTARALIDTGSTKSFLLKRVQQNLAIPLEHHRSEISGFGDTVVGSSKGRCYITVKSRTSNFEIKMQTIVVPSLAHFMPSRPVSIHSLDNLKGLELADPYFYKPSAIEMIIGSDYLPVINLSGVKINKNNNVEARESHFGWYLMGSAPSTTVQSFHAVVQPSRDAALHEQLKQFWEIEEAEKPKIQSDSDLYCEEFYLRTTAKQPDGRYVVRLPFKEQFPCEMFLGPSRNMALAQYHRMEKTLDKTPQLKTQYHEVLQEYLELDHMEQISYFEPKAEKISAFFLPHHAVIKAESKSTKVRVVFNASKRTTSGFSLNDVLYQGPTLQTDLIQIVLRWRKYQYVFTGDIQRMYRQILVDQADRPYQQILFRNVPEGPVNTYQLKTVTFGVNCAPYLAIRTLLELAEDCRNLYPKASAILKNEMYVDDILSGGHNLEDAKLKQVELVKALESAGFPLKKVTANHHSLLNNLAREYLLDEEFLKFNDSSTIKTLGIRWNALTDNFYYAVGPIEITPSATKRKILSIIARLFDPIGWLGPVIIVAKTLIQELWMEKCGWDECVPAPLLLKWNSFLKNLEYISPIKIPRWVNYSPTYRIQIHGFCDASEKAYCGAVYIRTETSDGKVESHLLVSKTKVAPIKRTTVPKLELCGAVLVTKLIQSVIMDYKCPYELCLWTDSSIVLGWLQKPPHTLKTFVAHRVAKIVSIANTNLWKHIKTEENPADLGTRGCTPQELAEKKLWWHGPTWLQLSTSLWPTPRTFDPTDLETKDPTNFHLEVNSTEPLEEFSSFSRALRVLCYRMRFINRLLKRPFSTEKFITAQEISSMKTRLLSLTQKTYFYREYECLKQKKPLHRKSNLLNLTPFIDKDGLLRVGGRLGNSGLSYEERHPIIIPEKSYFAKLLVKFTHLILLHSEHHIMLRAIRQGFYIARLKNLVRKCIRECKACTIYKHQFQQQIMAALPPERVNFSLPFTYTGVDFAGPFNIKASSLRNAKLLKGYAAVFVCFSTKAVHLEPCSDLSTDAFLACFDRFTGRRGLPKTMYSDNGRNFLGASYALLKDHNEFIKSAEKALADKYSILGFNWSFIPPYAPHMGGLWEAAVRSMKSHLKKVATPLSFTFEEFTTFLVRIEAVLNSRPLSPITDNPNEPLPLTPGHLLRGAPLTSIPEAPLEPRPEEIPHLKRWERLKALQHIFANRWKAEYITELQRRFKWKTERHNLTQNDIVVIKDESLPPTEWLLGRVTNVIYGRDSKVRVVELQTKNGPLVRPVVKLCLLPTGNETAVENKTINSTVN